MHERDLWRVARASRARDPSRPRSRRASTRARPRVSARDCVHAIDTHAMGGRPMRASSVRATPRAHPRPSPSLETQVFAINAPVLAKVRRGSPSRASRPPPTARLRPRRRASRRGRRVFSQQSRSLFRPTRVWNAPVFAANATHRITLTDVIRRRARFRVVTRDFFFWLCSSEIFPRRDRRLTFAPSHSIHHSRPSRAAPLA